MLLAVGVRHLGVTLLPHALVQVSSDVPSVGVLWVLVAGEAVLLGVLVVLVGTVRGVAVGFFSATVLAGVRETSASPPVDVGVFCGLVLAGVLRALESDDDGGFLWLEALDGVVVEEVAVVDLLELEGVRLDEADVGVAGLCAVFLLVVDVLEEVLVAVLDVDVELEVGWRADWMKPTAVPRPAAAATMAPVTMFVPARENNVIRNSLVSQKSQLSFQHITISLA